MAWSVYCEFNSLAPGKFEWNFRYVVFKQILVIDGWGISCEIVLMWVSLDFTDDQSTLVQVLTGVKARYGGSNMKKINNGGRLLIFYMMESIKKVNWKNWILWLFSVTDPPKIQDGHQI